MTTQTHRPTVLLLAGYWLGAWAWDEVLRHLSPVHADAVALTLPGLDPHDPTSAAATLEDQVAAILDALEGDGVSAEHPAVLVAHSGANAPVSVVLDRAPGLVRRVVWVDSGPAAPSSSGMEVSAMDAPGLDLPPFDVLGQQSSLEGLDDDALERFRALAMPEPAGVVHAEVRLTNAARHAVPTTLVCCSIPGAVMTELAAGGHPMFVEVALLERADVIDLPTGHWPMWSRPADLAEIIAAEAARSV